ncbi:beta-amylase 7 [Tanacetum coccineum]
MLRCEDLPAGGINYSNIIIVVDMPSNLQQRDFAGTPYVPVYVLLPLGVINMKCESADPGGLLKQLRVLKSINVDGVIVSFHESGGNVGDDVCIPLPHWVAEIGRSNPDIFFTDRSRRRIPECLSWGVDKEHVLRGRTASEDGVILMIEIGLGPCGETQIPFQSVRHALEISRELVNSGYLWI